MTRSLRIMCLSNMYPGPDAPDYGAFVATMCDALERQGHEVTRVVIDRRDRGPLRTPAKYLGLLTRALRAARDVDVIYGHFLFPTGAIARMAGRRARRPWVLTAHGRDVRNLASSRIRLLTAPALRDAAAVIAVSRYLAGELKATGLASPPVDVIDMGVDTTRFRPGDRAVARRELGLPEEGRLVVAVGGLNERKNPERLLQAVARVRERRPDTRLALVGDGPLRETLLRRAAAMGLDAEVSIPGPVSHDDVVRWMIAADLLAIPSTVEPLGVVALEALACGRPVVATRIGGTSEVVGTAGTLVDPMDVGSIADGIARVLADPPDEATCVAAAADHAVDLQATRIARILARAAGDED